MAPLAQVEKELKPRSPEDRQKVKEINKMRSRRFMDRLPNGVSDKVRGVERIKSDLISV